jgi:hypothetical protein
VLLLLFAATVGAAPDLNRRRAGIGGLGLRLLIIEDQEATERLKNRVPPRKRVLQIRPQSSAGHGHARRQSPAGEDHGRAA